MNAKEKMAEGLAFCEENLVPCCQELVELQDTGILVDGKVRQLRGLFSFAGTAALPMAMEAVKMAAVKKIVGG